MHSGLNQPPIDDETFVPWTAPDNGWKKFNLKVCKSIDGGLTYAACGGVFRDSEGRWLLGYIGPSHIELADLWILLMGLQLAWERGVTHLHVESDSVALMEPIKNPANHHRPILVDSVVKLMARQEWQVKFELISEKANGLAQAVAGHGIGLVLGLHMVQGVQELQERPLECIGALTLDMGNLDVTF